MRPCATRARVTVVAAGTSDVAVSREAARTLRYYGEPVVEITDVGVAGLWRLLERVEEIRAMPVVIAVAGMDAALPTVLAGLVPGLGDRGTDLGGLRGSRRREFRAALDLVELRARPAGDEYRQWLRRRVCRFARAAHGASQLA